MIHPSFVSTVSPSISIFATRGRRIRPPSTVSNRLFTRRAPSHPPTISRGLSAFLSSILFLLLSLGGDRFAQPRSKKEKRFKEETFETREPLGLRSFSLSSPLLVYEPTSKLDYYPKIFLATASLFPLVYGIHPFKNFFSPLAWHDCARGFFRNPSIFLYFLFLRFSLETFVASS